MEKVKVCHEYAGSHHYMKTFAKTEHYCPGCGEQQVWVDEGPGDYYLGSDYVCANCCFLCFLETSNKADQEVCRQIRDGVTRQPSTPRGF